MRAAIVASLLMSLTSGVTAAAERAWTPETSIGMRYFAAPDGAYGESNVIGARVVFSPDGQRFFVITRRGELREDCNRYELLAFETKAVRAALAARRPAPPPRTFSTCSRDTLEAGITRARWTEDSAAIVFMATRDNEPRQVVRWNVESQQATQLTNVELNVDTFDYRAGALAYVAVMNTGRRTDWTQYPSTTIGAPELTAALGFATPTYATFVRAADGTTRQISAPQSGDWRRMGFVSPDGKKAVIVAFPEGPDVPAAWSRYRNSAGRSSASYAQYRIVDIATGESRPIVQAPLGHAIDNHTQPQVLWAPGSDRVIVVNTLLPLVEGEDARIGTSYIVEHDVRTGQPRVVGALPSESVDRIRKGLAPVMDARWLREGRELVVSGMAPSVAYRFANGRWSSRAYTSAVAGSDTAVRQGLWVAIRQDLNRPPELIASEGKKELALLPADSVLAGVALTPVEQVEWRTRNGGIWKGHLVLPTGLPASQPVPVILQSASHLYPTHFFPDGTLSAGFAAQAMASQGFAVLTFSAIGTGHDRTGPHEGTEFVAGVDAAVEFLRDRIRAPLGRVGLMGFSRSGYLTHYAISHPGEMKLSAAIVQDSADASYVQYLLDGALSSMFRSQYEDQYEGGKSFWENETVWMNDAPGFNADRIDVPLLLTRHGGSAGGLVTVLETYAGLRMNRRPVELRVLPEASHPLLRPAHRLSAMEAALDWMRFWLQDQEDPTEAKRAQYEHWHALRAERAPQP